MARMLWNRMAWLAAAAGGLSLLAGCDGTGLDPDIELNALLQALGSTLVFLLQNIVAG